MTQPPAIASLIPHQGAMCLLDAVTAWDAERITCSATSHRRVDNPLRHRGRLAPHAGVEYAAQAMAAHGALTARGAGGRPMLAVVNRLRWTVPALDQAAEPMEVNAWRVATLPDGQCYGFSLAAGGAVLVEGEAIVVESRAPDPLQDRSTAHELKDDWRR